MDDDGGKVGHGGNGELKIESGLSAQSEHLKEDDTCSDVIKVYIFKADDGDDDLGKSSGCSNIIFAFYPTKRTACLGGAI